MHLQLVMFHQTTLDQHLTDFLPLVPLQLHNLSILWVLHNSSVAGKLLLGNFHNLLEVVLSGETLKNEICTFVSEHGIINIFDVLWYQGL